MKVGLLCSQDWANFQWGLTKSLQAVGVETISYKLGRHLFGYEEQCEVITVPKIKETFGDCDVVLLVHSDWELMEYLTCRVIPVHTGTKYRQHHEQINTYFDRRLSIIALPEFQKYAPNYKYLVGAMEVEREVKPVGEKLVVGHFPSNPGVKGTNEIMQVLYQLQDSNDFAIVHSTERVSHEESLNRINDCDIYVELLAKTQGGKPYGSFGMTALEAACLGKIVITQNLNDEGLYGRTYGPCLLNFIQNESDLKKTLSMLLQYKGEYLTGQMDATKQWVKKYHSYKSTGEKLLSYLNEI